MNMDMNMNNMQAMSFHWGKNAIILFSGWPGHNHSMYILALLFVFMMAAVVELLSHRADIDKAEGTFNTQTACSRAFVYALRVGLAYLVMLAVMSFNVGVLIAAIAGHVVGFFMAAVGALRRSNQEEHHESHV